MTWRVLAIDPSAREAACALFEDGVLTDVLFTSQPFFAVNVVVVERMQADERTRRVDVRGVLDCAFTGGYAAGCAVGWSRECDIDTRVIALTPQQWKNSEAKPVQHARLFGVNSDLTGLPAVLSDAEQRVLGGLDTARVIAAAVDKGAANRWAKPGVEYYPRSFTAHNLLDAAALGAFHLGRLEKR